MYKDIPEPFVLDLIKSYQPTPPADTSYIFRWFLDLSAARSTTQYGLAALTWTDIDAYFSRRVIFPNSYEIRAVQALDSVFLSVQMTDEVQVIGSEGFKNGNKAA